MSAPLQERVALALGRELDALVHEQVMGKCAHTCVFEQQYDEDGEPEYEGDSQTYRCTKCRGAFSGLLYMPGTPVCPKYSTDWGFAMKVFERMVERLGVGDIRADMEDAREPGFIVWVTLGMEGEGRAVGPLPEAICRAALAAVAPQGERAGRGE